MLIIDANIWVAAYVHADPEHQRSQRWLRETIKGGEQITAPRILLVEVISTLERTNNTQYRVTLQALMRARVRWVEVDAQLIEHALTITSDIKLKAHDCLYIAVAEQLNVPLYTWDGEVNKRAGTRIRVYKPN